VALPQNYLVFPLLRPSIVRYLQVLLQLKWLLRLKLGPCTMSALVPSGCNTGAPHVTRSLLPTMSLLHILRAVAGQNYAKAPWILLSTIKYHINRCTITIVMGTCPLNPLPGFLQMGLLSSLLLLKLAHCLRLLPPNPRLLTSWTMRCLQILWLLVVGQGCWLWLFESSSQCQSLAAVVRSSLFL
jgi:hypothetical protein